MITVRPYAPGDEQQVWGIFRQVVEAGDTFVFPQDADQDFFHANWLAYDTFVAENGKVLGTFILKANQPGLGDHVANAAFMVHADARGMGVGRLLGQSALAEAKARGFKAMQFNFVVSSNTAAVNLWRSLGLQIVGTVPGAFRHAALGPTDIYVMYKELD